MQVLDAARRFFFDGLKQLESGRFEEAESLLRESLRHAPERTSTLTNLSAVQLRLGKFRDALDSSSRAIKGDPRIAEAWLNMGSALLGLKRFDEALAPLDRAIALKPESAEAWSNKGAALCGLLRLQEALDHHDRAIALKPEYAEGWTNKGLVLTELRRFSESLSHHEQAVALSPDYAEAWFNIGVTLASSRRFAEALAHFDRAIALKPSHAPSWSAKATALAAQKQYEAALPFYDRALALDPALGTAMADSIHAQLHAGIWRDLDRKVSDLVHRVVNQHQPVSPFALLSIVDSPALQFEAAKAWVNDHCRPYAVIAPPKALHHRRIKIGYFSADFKNHPVSRLTVELFELHDRKRFEVFGFSFETASPGDGLRRRLENAFDQFIDVEGDSDLEIAKRSRALEIDIAVDLGGHTQGARTAAFSQRVAPIQVNYLGYPGTLGAGFMDYLLADKVVCPPQSLPWYTEKLAWLPHCFMPYDSTQEISERVFTRQEFGLPETGIVFCCFNNHYKINPAIFDVWMRLLAKVPGSVLWLSDGQQITKDNLAKEARARGLDPARLVFASRLDRVAEHLGRYRLADLFIDTLPYNAHTTACDALWAGVPVLTCSGQSFASRVAASLLHAAGLPELVTGSLADYEGLAVELAAQPQKLAALRHKLAANRLRTPLFDTRQLVRDMEQAYTTMFQRRQNGLVPDNIEI